MERIPDQIGYLIMSEDGAVIASGGDLENDERVANIFNNFISITKNINPEAFPEEDGFKRISLTYSDHCFIICLSNKKIHVVKKALKQQHSTAGDTSAKVNA
ncbi:ragulator complex protein LAMTOR4 [Ctenocephalides felis]|uniref:ragulator complex protein LAMTOR4 n=1 Tax=Ctenocephalides felis TaxID=7515 RepID=UPI000E6E2321|nr:ragulator complex protein LAMTOR4 [Ctenocephalides felis]